MTVTTDPVQKTRIATINPATGETLKIFEPHDADEIERRPALADATFRSWRRTSFARQVELVNTLSKPPW